MQSRPIRALLCLLAAAILGLAVSACGDGGGDSSADASSGGSSGGSGGGAGGSVSLSISGSPPSQILQDTQLDFTPTVSNPDNLSLSFTASGLPGWANINATTGRITGTPAASNVGMYSNIRITVSGGGKSATSSAYSIEVVSTATGSATLTWTPPTERTDGSPLDNLQGYKIYYGQSQGNLNQQVTINNAGVTAYVIDQLTPATWYFAAVAFDADGIESSFSNIASKLVTP